MKTLKSLSVGAFIMVACLLSGCASAAKSKGMVISQVPKPRTVHDVLTISVKGGEQTNPMWMSKISDDDFRGALLESLQKMDMFKTIRSSGNEPYLFEATLEHLEQPIMGFNMSVGLRVDWKLTRASDQKVLWHDKIESSHTATVGDAFAGIKRLRLATEGAARANIQQALTKLSTLDF
jgi:hypothetical protein